MPCYSPLKGYRSREGVDPGQKSRITFNPLKALNSHVVTSFPCGQCVGCRMDRVSQWGLRCMHEAQMHHANSFLTLTYSDEHLPADYSVKVEEMQLFMKRLRHHLGSQVRFFGCGEYGDTDSRPHYHALIFGCDFSSDRKFWGQSNGEPLYTSDTLAKAWSFGHAWIGSVTYQSACYVAGYVQKKIGGEKAASHYLRTHPKGYAVQVQPEFATQSRNPGIGADWFNKYKTDAFPSDFLVVDGKEVPVPRYYTSKLTEEEAKPIKRKRKQRTASPQAKANNTPARLLVRETVRKDRLSRLKRTL